MKRTLLPLLCVLLCVAALCGCAESGAGMTEEERAALIAYRYPKPPTIQVTTDSPELLAAFGDVADGARIVERNIDGWHKVQIVMDAAGRPEDWPGICAALAAGSARYKDVTSVELVTSRGALLASAIDGAVTYDAYETIREPRRRYEHAEDLTVYDAGPYFVTNKNQYYHKDGMCSAKLSRPYVTVDANAAVDELETPCPICAARISAAVAGVERTELPPERPQPIVLTDDAAEPDALRALDPGERLVYVSTRSHTIHSIPDCSGMKNYTAMPQAEADARGYKYCSNCW